MVEAKPRPQTATDAAINANGPAVMAQPATPAETPANSGPQAAQVLASAQKLQEAERYPEALGALDRVRALNAEKPGHHFLLRDGLLY